MSVVGSLDDAKIAHLDFFYCLPYICTTLIKRKTNTFKKPYEVIKDLEKFFKMRLISFL